MSLELLDLLVALGLNGERDTSNRYIQYISLQMFFYMISL